jgi:uncharacterized repeat protein (TIGR02543 family)
VKIPKQYPKLYPKKHPKGLARVFAIALCAVLLMNLPALGGDRCAYALSSDLFLSEYVEGSGNNKAIELFNNTGSAIDLSASGYRIDMYLNGSTTPRTTIPLTGTIAPGGTYVLVKAHAVAALLAYANQIAAGRWFNGNDAVVLMKGTTMVDKIGIIGQNPSPAWMGGTVSTANQTLVRKPGITQGTTDNQPPYDPSIEWISYPVDTFTNLGFHNIGVYAVTFHPGDHGAFDPAGAPASQQVPSGKAAAAPTVVPDDGYIFTGWDRNFDAVFGDCTITALYARMVYLVTFRAGAHGAIDPAGAPATQQVLYGESAAAPTVVPDEGYLFIGWDQSYSPVTRDVILNAQYVQEAYTVLFDPGEHGMFDPAGAPASQQVLFGNAAMAPTVWADPGYVFTGWDRAFNVVTQDRIITAQYTRNIYRVVFVVGDGGVFNSGGGAQEQLVLFGDAAVRPADPGRTGYTFQGWYADASFLTEFDFLAGISGPATAYAKWAPAGSGAGTGTDPAPKTGDPSWALWLWILSLSGVGLAGMGIQSRRLR